MWKWEWGKKISYRETKRRIYDLEAFRGRISLEPITRLMERFGNLQDDFPSIHIAGTNGKGSTATILASILREEGYSVGTYTSPHLTDFRERVKVNGEKISKESIERIFREIDGHDIDVSFFEFTTALAFIHFARSDIDVAVLETGMGGRLDATNLVEPEISIITNVAREHTNWLGESLEEIAYEKAGIVKEGVPVLSGVSGNPRRVVKKVADEKGSELHGPRELATEVPSRGMNLQLDYDSYAIDTGLVGGYQRDNTNMALNALEILDDFPVSTESIISGLENVSLPGRMEVVSRSPLVILEGAHNPAGMECSADTLEKIGRGKTVAVVSIMADKEYDRMLETVEGFSDLVILSEAEIDRAADPERLARHVKSVDFEVEPDIGEALEKAMAVTSRDDTIVFTGSLYFVGDVRRYTGPVLL